MPFAIPFRGLFYADRWPGYLGRVLAPPFDMIGAGRQELLDASDHNIAWLTVADDAPGYPGVAQRFAQWRKTGVLQTDHEPALYSYEQTTRDTVLQGFFAAVRVGPPEESAVYPHEDTFAIPIMDRLALLRATRCALEPVLAVYADDTGTVAQALTDAKRHAPLLEATTPDGAIHRLWRLTDHRDQQVLVDVMARTKAVIADGHHRWAAANVYATEMDAAGAAAPDAPHRFALMLLVEERTGGLRCDAFHRVIQRLPAGICPRRLAQHLGPGFTVEELPVAGEPVNTAVRKLLDRIAEDDGSVFGCVWRDGAAIVHISDLEEVLTGSGIALHPIIREFDVALLHDLILKPRLGCRGEFSDQACAITFEKDPTEAWRKVASGSALMAWFVNPASTRAVMRAAFAGLRVPQKTTHFHPKPPSGIVMCDLSPDPVA